MSRILSQPTCLAVPKHQVLPFFLFDSSLAVVGVFLFVSVFVVMAAPLRFEVQSRPMFVDGSLTLCVCVWADAACGLGAAADSGGQEHQRGGEPGQTRQRSVLFLRRQTEKSAPTVSC